MNKKARSLFDILVASGLISTLLILFVYYLPRLEAQREQIELMRQGLERKAHLTMTVVPSCVWITGGYPNGTVWRKNTTLTLSRTVSFTFTIYVSNVGDAFAHLLYYSVFLSCDSEPRYTQMSIPYSKTIVLKPHESVVFEYPLDPLNIPSAVLSNTNSFSLTFTVGSTETTIQKAVSAEFED